jgi:hypothetical protein
MQIISITEKNNHITGNDGLNIWTKYKLQELQNEPLNIYMVAEELYSAKENYNEVRKVVT